MLIHPISITHEDTFMPKKIRKFFRKSPRPTAQVSPKLKKQTDIHPKPHQDPKPKQTYSSLEGNNWLNDDVINNYLRMVNAVDGNILIFSSYFHTAFREGGFKRVKDYYRKHALL